MVKALTFVAIGAFALTGCGGDSKTYSTSGTLPEGTEGGSAVVVQGNTDSKVGITYTTLEDGSILVQCGDGDGYNCNVQMAEQISDAGDAETPEAGDDPSSPCGAGDSPRPCPYAK